MREHGLLKRVLLVYDHVRGRIAAKQSFPPDTVASALATAIIAAWLEEIGA